MIANTCVTDVTGHPACSVPAGLVNGLPTGMMIIGKHFDEPRCCVSRTRSRRRSEASRHRGRRPRRAGHDQNAADEIGSETAVETIMAEGVPNLTVRHVNRPRRPTCGV
jgi:Amidase